MADLVQRTGLLGGQGQTSSGLKKGSSDEVTLPESKVNAKGEVVDLSTGDVVGRVIEGDAQALVGSLVTQAGQILGKDGVVLGKAAPLDSVLKPVGDVAGGVTETVGGIVGGVTGGLGSGRKGKAADGSGHDDDEGGRSPEFETTEKGKSRAGAIGMKGDDQQVTSALSPHAPSQTDGGPEGVSAEPMASKPVDMTDEKLGGAQKPAQDAVSKPTDQVGEKPGEVVEATGAPDANRGLDAGDAKNMSSASIGTKIDDKLSGVTGSKSKQELPTAGDPAERVAETAGEVVPGVSALEGLKVNKSGNVVDDDGKPLGKLVESDLAALAGKEVGKDGKIVDPESGNILGKVEPIVDKSILKGAKVNKLGNLVDENGRVVGKVAEGVDVKKVVGRRADANGDIWNDSGERIGSSNPIPENEREQQQGETKPFEAFEGATVDGKGNVVFEGEVIGKVTSGDAKRLRGMKVDADGDILDSVGNVIGTAERWEEPEPEPEPEVDTSILAGKRVNKAGNVVDGQGNIFGRVVEGDPKKLQGRMCDKKGNVLSESGDVIGRAEVVPEGEREGMKEGPFAELGACSVTRDGKVVTAGGDVVGRLVSGDAEKLFGRPVDEDGDITDRNGNVLGKAERWTEPIVEKRKGPMAGRRVNKQGEVVDEDGNVIGRLTSGDLSICLGKEVDDDGDVIDGKGNVVGHVSLLADIKEPEESPEDKEKREQLENDKKLAIRMTTCIEQCLDRIRPICKMITDKIEKANRTPKDELDEEELVKQVKPLIEEGGQILNECNGIIRALDPDGRIQANAKHKTATREATPEEFRLADVLKELTGTVTKTIEDAKKMIEDMPHAKKELNPLWGLLTEPLFQILAAVGLLLTGVLGLVGRLLSGLGLGGLVDTLLGGLGLKRVLEGLGLGMVPGLITGKDQKKK